MHCRVWVWHHLELEFRPQEIWHSVQKKGKKKVKLWVNDVRLWYKITPSCSHYQKPIRKKDRKKHSDQLPNCMILGRNSQILLHFHKEMFPVSAIKTFYGTNKMTSCERMSVFKLFKNGELELSFFSSSSASKTWNYTSIFRSFFRCRATNNFLITVYVLIFACIKFHVFGNTDQFACTNFRKFWN